jgi:regulator of sigma E protease
MLSTIISSIQALSSNFLSILYAIIGFCGLITIHEFGHYLFAKLFGIHCPTFSVGVGPTLASKKIAGTNFRIAPIPLGGYCEIAGLAEIGQGDQEHAHVSDDTSFDVKPYWQKMLVLLGGIIFNLAFAYITMITLYMVGKPTDRNLFVSTIAQGSPAEDAGLQKNDVVLSLGQNDIQKDPSKVGQALAAIQKMDNTTLPITIERDGLPLDIPITIPKASTPKSYDGKLGITFGTRPSGKFITLPFAQAVQRGIAETNDLLKAIFQGLKNMLTTRTLKGAGPVRIISDSVSEAKSGLANLFYLLAIISLNLAVFNLFPIPALDGGQLLFTTIEALIGRRIRLEVKNVIFIASWVLLLSLILIFTYYDISYLLS